jgi:hypothetical protein
MADECGKRIPYRLSDTCMLEAGHHGGCGLVGATLGDCRRLLRLAVKVMQHGTDNQLIDAANFITARIAGSAREPSALIEQLWGESK